MFNVAFLTPNDLHVKFVCRTRPFVCVIPVCCDTDCCVVSAIYRATDCRASEGGHPSPKKDQNCQEPLSDISSPTSSLRNSLTSPKRIFFLTMALVRSNRAKRVPKRNAAQMWLHGYTQTQLENDDVDILKGDCVQAARDSHRWSLEEAIKYLIKATESEPVASDDDGSGPQKVPPHRFPYALFCDLDEMLFGGVLKGNVHLRFDQTLPNRLAGSTTRPSQEAQRRITIDLSKDLVFKRGPPTILEVLLHQMIHAYLLQCCGPKSRGRGHDLSHGAIFSAAAYLTIKACGFHHFAKFPSTVGVLEQRRRRYAAAESQWSLIERCICSQIGAPLPTCKEVCHHIKSHVNDPEIDLDHECPKDRSGKRR